MTVHRVGVHSKVVYDPAGPAALLYMPNTKCMQMDALSLQIECMRFIRCMPVQTPGAYLRAAAAVKGNGTSMQKSVAADMCACPCIDCLLGHSVCEVL